MQTPPDPCTSITKSRDRRPKPTSQTSNRNHGTSGPGQGSRLRLFQCRQSWKVYASHICLINRGPQEVLRYGLTSSRRTGITLAEGKRDEHGMEEVDGIFSSPEKSPARENGFNNSESMGSDMSMDEGRSTNPTSTSIDAKLHRQRPRTCRFSQGPQRVAYASSPTAGRAIPDKDWHDRIPPENSWTALFTEPTTRPPII